MFQTRLISTFIAAGAITALATPASAIVAFHYHTTQKTPAPTPPKTPMPPKQAGSWGGGSHSGGSWGCCGGSGGTHGSGSSHTVWTKPRLGDHPKGVHFYGMGGGSIHIRGYIHGRIGPVYNASGGGGSGGASHPPSGMHPMGMHYYGMSGGSLAARYGHLEHDFGKPLHLSHHWGAGSWQGSTSPAPMPPSSPPPSSGSHGPGSWGGHGHQWGGGSWGGGSWGGRSWAWHGHHGSWGPSHGHGGPMAWDHRLHWGHGSHGGVYAFRVLFKEHFSYRVSSGGKSSSGSHSGSGSSGSHWGSSGSHGVKPKTWFSAAK